MPGERLSRSIEATIDFLQTLRLGYYQKVARDFLGKDRSHCWLGLEDGNCFTRLELTPDSLTFFATNNHSVVRYASEKAREIAAKLIFTLAQKRENDVYPLDEKGMMRVSVIEENSPLIPNPSVTQKKVVRFKDLPRGRLSFSPRFC